MVEDMLLPNLKLLYQSVWIRSILKERSLWHFHQYIFNVCWFVLQGQEGASMRGTNNVRSFSATPYLNRVINAFYSSNK